MKWCKFLSDVKKKKKKKKSNTNWRKTRAWYKLRRYKAFHYARPPHLRFFTFSLSRVSSKVAGKYVSAYVPRQLTCIITSSLRTSPARKYTHTHTRTNTHTHTHNNTHRARQESFHYKTRPVCLTVLEQPYSRITSTPHFTLVNVLVNGK